MQACLTLLSCPTDGRSYYTQIYAQSFKTERVDAGPEDLTNTKMTPGPGTVSQVYSSQLQGQLENFDSDSRNNGTTPTMAIEFVSTVKTEPKDPDEQSGENRFQLQMLPNQVPRKHEIEVHHQQTKGSDDCNLRTGPSKSDAHSSKLATCLSSHSPTISRYLPSLQNVIGDASQGLRISTRTHSLQVSRSQSAEDVEKLEGHATLPISSTVPSKQNTIGVNSGESGIFSGAQPLLVSRRLLSSEDVEELYSHVKPSISKTASPLQNRTGSVDRSVSQGSRTFARACHIPVASDLSSAEDVEGLDDPAAVRDGDRQGYLTIPSRINTTNTASECPKEMIALKLAQTEKSLSGNRNSVSMESSFVDVKQLSTHADSRGSHQHRQTSKPSKRGNASSIGSTSR